MHFTNFPHSSGIYPRYQHGDFNTNSESYYKYLASLNEQLDNFVKLLEKLDKRELNVEDTNTVDLTKLGEWKHGLNPEDNIEQVIKLKADVLLSSNIDYTQLLSMGRQPQVRELTNAIKALPDGLYSKDLEAVMKELDGKIADLNERVDNIDPDGTLVTVDVDTEQITSKVPVEYRNINVAINSVDPTKFNIALITDLHLYPENNFVQKYNNFRVLKQFKRLENVCDVAVHNGDNVDSNSGSIGDGLDTQLPSDVKYSAQKNMLRFANTALRYGKTPKIGVVGNHDKGGVPYNWTPGHGSQMVLSKAEIEKTMGSKLYGGIRFPDKKIAMFYLYTDDFSEKTDSNGNFQETDHIYQGGAISSAQLLALSQFMNTVKTDEHFILVGHRPIVANTGEKTMLNGAITEQLLSAFVDGTDFTIPANTLAGIDNVNNPEIKFNNATRGKGNMVGYFCGHLHTETDFPITTEAKYKMISFINAFGKKDPWQKGTDKEGSFYGIEVDTTARKVICRGVGNGTDFVNYTY